MDVLLMTAQENLDAIGIRYLHYGLLAQGYDSALLYLPAYQRDDIRQTESLLRFVGKHRPKLIGMSLMSTQYHESRVLTKALKENFNSTPVVWGGIFPTIAPEICLEHADYACVGEGERTLSDLAAALVNDRRGDIPSIRNLCLKDNGRIRKNELYPLLTELDKMPLCDPITKKSYIQHGARILELDRELYRKYGRYYGTVYSCITSRGCPFTCTYCCNNYISRLYHGNPVRKRSTESVISELKNAIGKTPFIRFVNFQDDCFLACSDEHLKEFCGVYKREINRPFIIRSVPIYITKEKLEYLKSAGLAWIVVGLQSGSDRVCREIYRRNFSRREFLKAARLIKECRVAAFYDVILDNPYENEEDRMETILTLAETPKPYYTQFLSLSFYHGTDLYEKARREHPEFLDDSFEKDLQAYKNTPQNQMARIATFISEKRMKKLIGLYKTRPGSFSFRVRLFILKTLSAVYFEPLAYFRVLKLSQGGSLAGALRVSFFFSKYGFRRYLKQFHLRPKARAGGIA